jgi:hypothetical protein
MELKYQMRFSAVENAHKDFLNNRVSEKNNLEAAFLDFRQTQANVCEKATAFFREERAAALQSAQDGLEVCRTVIHDLAIKKEAAKHERFFEAEILALESNMVEQLNLEKQIPAETESLNTQIEALQTQWKNEEAALDAEHGRAVDDFRKSAAAAAAAIAEIDATLATAEDSFYGWLTRNRPGWEENIGKVVDEKNVLFNTELNPRPVDTAGLYGVEINLDEISKTVKVSADYEAEKATHLAQIETLRQNVADKNEALDKDRENLRHRFLPKIRGKKDAVRENDYRLELAVRRRDEAKAELSLRRKNADDERSRRLAEIDAETGAAKESEHEAIHEVDRLKGDIEKKIRARERERDKLIDEERIRINARLSDIDEQCRKRSDEMEKQCAEIRAQKNDALAGSGADTKRLNAIDETLNNIWKEFDFIEKNSSLVERYRYDKERYLDRVADFKQSCQRALQQLEIETRKHEQQTAEITRILESDRATVSKLQSEQSEIREDIAAFDEFRESECCASITESIADSRRNDGSAATARRRARTIIAEIKDIHYDKLNSRRDGLRNTASEFLGRFSDNNIFRFPRRLSDDSEHLAFAEMLSGFIGECKIERIQEEVNERFAQIVNTIGSEAGNLLSESGNVQKIIAKINADFLEKNFAGVIRKIELRLDDSRNEVVQLLREIKKYSDEHALELGGAGLFATVERGGRNQRAVDLLKQFLKKINESKRDVILLADSFELKFRIEENQNDTGWVEKLSNVGSDGTDVLVKAMVNIMLLNVFKEAASRKFKDFRLHCMMDEIGRLHPDNVRGILKFANDRNILLINGSPIENDAMAFRHIYKLGKDAAGVTRVKRLVTNGL